jgi:hypothetical protein
VRPHGQDLGSLTGETHPVSRSSSAQGLLIIMSAGMASPGELPDNILHGSCREQASGDSIPVRRGRGGGKWVLLNSNLIKPHQFR